MLVSGSVRRHCRTDEELLVKLSVGDSVALEAKYHAPCLASLYKKAERVKAKKAKKMGQLLDDRRKNTSKDVMSFFWPSKMILPTCYGVLARKTVLKKTHLVKAASIARKKHKNTNLTDLLKRIARWTPFHHHWYLSSLWFFMVLTLIWGVKSQAGLTIS